MILRLALVLFVSFGISFLCKAQTKFFDALLKDCSQCSTFPDSIRKAKSDLNNYRNTAYGSVLIDKQEDIRVTRSNPHFYDIEFMICNDREICYLYDKGENEDVMYELGTFFNINLEPIVEVILFQNIIDGPAVSQSSSVCDFFFRACDYDSAAYCMTSLNWFAIDDEYYLKTSCTDPDSMSVFSWVNTYYNGVVASVLHYYSDNILGENIKHGIHEYYGKDGNLVLSFNYHMGCLDGKIQAYEDGKMIFSGNYKHGLVHGKWEQFSKEGELIKEAIFNKGVLKSYNSYKD